MRRIMKNQHQLLGLLLLSLHAIHVVAIRRLPYGFGDRQRLLSLETEQPQAKEDSPLPNLLEGRGLVADPRTADDHLVTDLPGQSDFDGKHWAGLLTVDEAGEGKHFYWFFEAEHDSANKPLIIWLNGGPGCSSMDGMFLENGPFKVDDQMKLTPHPYSWHKAANLLYIDQPVGTGFSFTGKHKYCDNDDCINRNMYTFLQKFFHLHDWMIVGGPEGTSSKPIFFSGESQAGHYIPSMVDHIVKQNAAMNGQGTKEQLLLDVKGMAIGNGWFDPVNQYDVSDFAHGVGMISEGQYHTLQRKREECVRALHAGRYYTPVCFALLDEVVAATGSESRGYVSLYDYRLFDDPGNRVFPPGHKTVEKYLNIPAVKKALHASESPLTFQECTDPPYDHLKNQDGLGVTDQIGRILEAGVRALFFNGAFDVICNHYGNEAGLRDLKWSGQEEFETASRSIWLPSDNPHPGGYAKSSGPLTFLVVLGAGHMVPLDVPQPALDMITRFINDQPLGDKPQGISMSVAPPVEGSSADGNYKVVKPPGSPKLSSVTMASSSSDEGTVTLTIDPPTDKGSAEDEMWYTILVNPGGSIVTPQKGNDDMTYTLSELQEGIDYSFQAVANNGGGASKPSEAVRLALGCTTTEVCQHGICGYDAEEDSKRCFCYQGWGGVQCQLPSQDDAVTQTNGEKDDKGDSSGSSKSSGVSYIVDPSCPGMDTQGCALRFTIPLRLCVEHPADQSMVPPVLEGPEEAHAFEGMLRRDLVHALGVHREQIVLRSLHPLNATEVAEHHHKSAPPPSKAAASSSNSQHGLEPVSLTFDLLYSPEPQAIVTAFTSLWTNQDGGALKYGVISSNFDLTQTAEISLVARDAPLSRGHPINPPLRRSVVVSVGAFALVLTCLILIVRAKRSWWSGNANGSGRGRRRTDTDEVVPGDDDDDNGVEAMEIRTSTSGSGSRSGSLNRLTALGIGQTSSARPIDDGSNERLV